MKKYIVVKEYRSIGTYHIVGQFDNREDAEIYARLMKAFAWVYEMSE